MTISALASTLGTWPTAHEGAHTHRRKPMPKAVDFLDARLPVDMSRSSFDRQWDRSVEQTTALLAETDDRSRFYRDVAYRLSRACLPKLQAGTRP